MGPPVKGSVLAPLAVYSSTTGKLSLGKLAACLSKAKSASGFLALRKAVEESKIAMHAVKNDTQVYY